MVRKLEYTKIKPGENELGCLSICVLQQRIRSSQNVKWRLASGKRPLQSVLFATGLTGSDGEFRLTLIDSVPSTHRSFLTEIM
jgi:hypothetical protein